jgi:hypothetical protein
MGLGYDEERDMLVLVAQELVVGDETTGMEPPEPRVVRIWATRDLMRALSEHAIYVVKQGRPDPKNNGHLTYYYS